jgi:hypothetical protein
MAKSESDWLIPAGIGLAVGFCIAHMFGAGQQTVLVPVGETASDGTGLGSVPWIPSLPPYHPPPRQVPLPRPIWIP